MLVVDDDRRIAAMLAKGLRTKSYDVEIVGTGADALARVATNEIDVLLLDLGLPDIDGLDVLRRALAAGCTTPVIVVTARTDPTDREIALELGVRAYITKPFVWSDVWDAVDACVAERA